MWPPPSGAPLLLLLTLAAVIALAAPPAASVSPPTSPCKASIYPKLCRAIVAPLRFQSNPYATGRYSVKQALKQARKTSEILDRYLSRQADFVSGGHRGMYDAALEDCKELSFLSSVYLEKVEAELDRGVVSGREAVARVRALMSAVVTNQQTCFDGLEAASARSGVMNTKGEIYGPLENATQIYGVSLELVTSALGPRQGSAAPQTWSATEGPDLGTGGSSGRNLIEDLRYKMPVNGSVMVAKDGSGDFMTVGEAVAFAPNGTSLNDGYFFIIVKEGVYEENILVARNKKNLVLIGAGINRTVITGNRNVVDGWSTFNSATFAVQGERFIAVDMTFENTAGPEKHQAVAVRNSADLSAFYRCSFVGYQDTLYVHSLRQFYRDCDIYGTVDFIFGNAAAVLQNCRIYARKPLPEQKNIVTAQGRTHPNQTTGISIHNCTVAAAPDLEAADLNSTTKTYLGRPWKEFSRTVYMQSYIGAVIEPVGWMEWNETFALSTLFYGEFQNQGPRANTTDRVQWPGYISLMDTTQALSFTVYNFTAGDAWLPYTSIPCNGGLL